MSTPKNVETILAGLLALLERFGDGVSVQAEEDVRNERDRRYRSRIARRYGSGRNSRLAVAPSPLR